jgi:hypothetical protein
MATQASGVNNQLPRVSYIKAIDVWMSTCMVFVFGGLLEFAVANVITRNEQKQRDKALVSMVQADKVDFRSQWNSSALLLSVQNQAVAKWYLFICRPIGVK